MAILKTADDALALPNGRLTIAFSEGLNVEASFSQEDVAEAAELLITRAPDTKVYSQAGVIAKAGKYGWGLGNVYGTI